LLRLPGSDGRRSKRKRRKPSIRYGSSFEPEGDKDCCWNIPRRSDAEKPVGRRVASSAQEADNASGFIPLKLSEAGTRSILVQRRRRCTSRGVGSLGRHEQNLFAHLHSPRHVGTRNNAKLTDAPTDVITFVLTLWARPRSTQDSSSKTIWRRPMRCGAALFRSGCLLVLNGGRRRKRADTRWSDDLARRFRP
jgi:hypothetical protein